MAFIPINYLTADNALDQITQDATRHFQVLDQGIVNLERAATGLAAMQAEWTPAATFINDQAAAFPADATWQRLKARKDKIASNFIEMRDLAIAVRDAAQAARG